MVKPADQRRGVRGQTDHAGQSFQPDLEEWQHNLKLQIPYLDEHSFIVAHGLGGLSALKFLEEHYNRTQLKIGGLMLVAAFDTPLVAWSELNKMVQAVKLDLNNLSHGAKRFVMLLSSNDPYVPAPISLRLGHSLNAQILKSKMQGILTSWMAMQIFQSYSSSSNCVWQMICKMLQAFKQ